MTAAGELENDGSELRSESFRSAKVRRYGIISRVRVVLRSRILIPELEQASVGARRRTLDERVAAW